MSLKPPSCTPPTNLTHLPPPPPHSAPSLLQLSRPLPHLSSSSSSCPARLPLPPSVANVVNHASSNAGRPLVVLDVSPSSLSPPASCSPTGLRKLCTMPSSRSSSTCSLASRRTRLPVTLAASSCRSPPSAVKRPSLLPSVRCRRCQGCWRMCRRCTRDPRQTRPRPRLLIFGQSRPACSSAPSWCAHAPTRTKRECSRRSSSCSNRSCLT
mmetsp:Transcript_9199/g.29297  ORF Transcript_9199/g.29297 Transcript_9199/m.29297 type:complete len:211 (-) Transcript_9199:610-1242(-)